MAKKILITGATGFVGIHLLEQIINAQNADLYGTYHSESSLENISNHKEKINLTKLDLQSEENVNKLIEVVKPDIIYHLAASTSAAESFKSPKETVVNNITSEINLLEAVKNNNLLATKILIVSSAEVYGDVKKEDLPIDEDTPFNPTNPYAVSKLAQDFLGRQYFLAYKLNIIRVRPFNHIGPGQSDNFVVSSFAKKIVEIEKGKREPVLPVGNLEARRDFTDVRDMVKAYILLMERGILGEVYNIGLGKSFKIADILDQLISISGVKVKIESDKSLFRPIDNPDFVCNYSRLKSITGWVPEIALEKTLTDVINYWRSKI
jgi:GDP-4-dehydro-6-deoxy-D-mannose reductase